jgi:cell surface protein SprA
LLQDDNGNLITKDSISGNFIPRYQISAVSITEQFSPLIGFDVKWKIGFLDNWGTKIEFKRDRNVTLSLANNQVTEVRGKEVVVGVNKTFPNFKFPFGNKKREGKSLTTRVDVSSRNNVTVIRRIVEADNQAGGGQRIISIKFTADYAVSTKLNIRAFYDRIVTTPFISNSFPTANTNAGVAIRFSLTQ